MEGLSVKLKELRVEKGMSQSEVSRAIGLTRCAYTNYEKGIREPSLTVFKKICIVLGVSADYLLGITDAP
ncbi:helix-turn-helix domain-containing protein [Anaerocaecibacter muris]|uniref:helix-turn-helix domain-containing protein n=1 Tax=Anaerocaecibacter muris TaxID=2941513 RepID=UPI003F68DC0A